MDCGIVGLPSTGKTSLFNALTGQHATTFSGGGLKAHVGMASIPDPRLDMIANFVPTQKIVPATIRLVDLPGLPAGSGPDAVKKINAFLSDVRQVDAVCHVVRCFDSGEPARPTRDIDLLEAELLLADLAVAEASLDKAVRAARSGEPELKARQAFLEKVVAALDEEKPLRTITDWSESDEQMLRGYGMITAKQVLYVANVDEDDVSGESAHARAVAEFARKNGGLAVTLCAKLEAEIAELDEADRAEMLESMGLNEPAVGRMARAAQELLGLASFYTAGDKEVRAWSVGAGAAAPEAAGVIHSDIQRGFIRAECYAVDDLVQYKSEKAIKEAGKLRSEGKNYHMQDGDVVHFLFNV